MSQMNPKEVFDNTAYSVQLTYIAGQRLYNGCQSFQSHYRSRELDPISGWVVNR